jgi:hypothetical protein
VSSGCCEQIAKERNCSQELVRAIFTDCIGKLHEFGVKQGLGQTMFETLFEFGELAAWHVCGILEEAGPDKGYFAEHYLRLAPDVFRFKGIRDQWEQEQQIARSLDD